MNQKKRLQGWLSAISLALLMLAIAGCGGSGGVKVTKTTASSTITTTGGTSGAVALSVSAPTGVTLSIPANTVFENSAADPLTGTITTSVSYSNLSSDLPVAARTPPTGSTLVAFAEVDLTAATQAVKQFSNPVSLVFKVPGSVAATGDALVIYSFDSGTGQWSFAGTEIVDASGNISTSISHLSIWALFKTATPPPVKVADVAAAAGNAQATVSWSAVTGATSYNIYYGTTPGLSIASGTKVTGAVSGQAVTGLANFTRYYFVVTAVNAGGESVVSTEVSDTPALPKPSGIVASAGNGQVTVTWSAVTGATSYNIYYGTNSAITTTTGTKLAGATSGQTITGLYNGTTYYFFVTAVDAGGESVPSSTKSSVPGSVPGSPTSVVTVSSPGQVTVSWGTVTYATSYNVYYLQAPTIPLAATVIASGTKLNTANTTLDVTGLTTGSNYWFIVTAVDSYGESGGQTKPKLGTP